MAALLARDKAPSSLTLPTQGITVTDSTDHPRQMAVLLMRRGNSLNRYSSRLKASNKLHLAASQEPDPDTDRDRATDLTLWHL